MNYHEIFAGQIKQLPDHSALLFYVVRSIIPAQPTRGFIEIRRTPYQDGVINESEFDGLDFIGYVPTSPTTPEFQVRS